MSGNMTSNPVATSECVPLAKPAGEVTVYLTPPKYWADSGTTSDCSCTANPDNPHSFLLIVTEGNIFCYWHLSCPVCFCKVGSIQNFQQYKWATAFTSWKCYTDNLSCHLMPACPALVCHVILTCVITIAGNNHMQNCHPSVCCIDTHPFCIFYKKQLYALICICCFVVANFSTTILLTVFSGMTFIKNR